MTSLDLSGRTIHYVEDLSKWEAWQRDYRYGALFVFPPSPLREQINALRATYDPRSQSYCDAHISLTVPFPRALDQRDWTDLMHVTNSLAPLTVIYGPPRSYPGVPGVVLHIEPFDRFNELVLALESAHVFLDARPRTYPFSPHMTIAEFISLERTGELLKGLPKEGLVGTFSCQRISYAVPDEHFHFNEQAYLELNGS